MLFFQEKTNNYIFKKNPQYLSHLYPSYYSLSQPKLDQHKENNPPSLYSVIS